MFRSVIQSLINIKIINFRQIKFFCGVGEVIRFLLQIDIVSAFENPLNQSASSLYSESPKHYRLLKKSIAGLLFEMWRMQVNLLFLY